MGDAQSIVVQIAKIIASSKFAAVAGALIEPPSTAIVDRHAIARLIDAPGKIVTSRHVSTVTAAFVILSGERVVYIDAVSVLINPAQIVAGIHVISVAGLLIEIPRPDEINRHTKALIVNPAEIVASGHVSSVASCIKQLPGPRIIDANAIPVLVKDAKVGAA